MSLTPEEARTRVARGAAHLDCVRPGWEHRIDVGTLTLHDPCGCIVGQLEHRWFTAGYEALGLTHADTIRMGLNLMNCRCGCGQFDLSRCASYRQLQDAWIEAIAARRHPVTEPQPEALVCG